MEQLTKKHLSPWIAWSIVILAFGIGLFCVWYYYFQVGVAYDNAFTNSIGLKKKTTTTTTPTTTDTTANWKTLNNVTYNYTLKYPVNYYLENGLYDKINGVTVNKDKNIFIDKNSLNSQTYLYGGDYPQPYFDIVTTDQESKNLMSDEQNATKSEITFAGEYAVKTMLTKPSDFDGSYSGNLRFNHKGKGYTIAWRNTDGAGTHDKEIEQMLSTFQFTQ
jgi:hypothetical protein